MQPENTPQATLDNYPIVTIKDNKSCFSDTLMTHIAADLKTFFNAVINGDTLSVVEALQASVSIDSLDSESGDTALHLAVRHINNQMAALLLTLGANIEKRNNQGETALMVVCKLPHFTERLSLIHLLINNKANPLAIDHNGNTALTLHLDIPEPSISVSLVLIDAESRARVRDSLV